MGVFLTHQEILDFLKEKDLFDGTEKIIYATSDSTEGEMVLLVFNRRGVFIVQLTSMGKPSGGIIPMEKETLQQISFKKGVMAHQLFITRPEKTYVFRVNRTMVGYKEHKSDLADLLAQYGTK